MAMSPPGATSVKVEHVVRTSPADRAGLVDGDEIVEVDGTPTPSPSDVTRAVAVHGAGDSVAVVVRRGGQSRTMNVTLAPRPSTDISTAWPIR